MYIKDSTQYTLSQIRKAHPQVSIPEGADLTDLGYYRIKAVEPPVITANQRITKGEPEEYESGKWRETWVVTDISVDEWKANKIAELAALRYSKETAGITAFGVKIKTDLEAQSKLTGALNYVNLNPGALINWKAENGWVQLDPTMIRSIAYAVAEHVQACFTNERVHTEAINALETAEEVTAYDITTGWPG